MKPTTYSFPAITTDYSNLKIPLICAGGLTALILLASIGIKLTVCRNPNEPTGAVNVNINNSANNDNNTVSSADKAIKEAPPAPIIIEGPTIRTLEMLLKMKPSERTKEEQDRVQEHKWEQEEQEASSDEGDNPFQF